MCASASCQEIQRDDGVGVGEVGAEVGVRNGIGVSAGVGIEVGAGGGKVSAGVGAVQAASEMSAATIVDLFIGLRTEGCWSSTIIITFSNCIHNHLCQF